MAEGVPTNNQRGRRSGPCRLWGGLDKASHIVQTALLVRVQCFRKGLYKAVQGPSTRPIVLSMITQRYSLYLVHKRISIYANCDPDLWHPTSKTNRVHPLIMVNMSAKFGQEAHNGLVPIVLTRSMHGCTVAHTEPQQRYYSPSATLPFSLVPIAGQNKIQDGDVIHTTFWWCLGFFL